MEGHQNFTTFLVFGLNIERGTGVAGGVPFPQADGTSSTQLVSAVSAEVELGGMQSAMEDLIARSNETIGYE